jgi:hypothetical protein
MMLSQNEPRQYKDQKIPEELCIQIEKEEQQHGDDLTRYLYSKGAYPIQ